MKLTNGKTWRTKWRAVLLDAEGGWTLCHVVGWRRLRRIFQMKKRLCISHLEDLQGKVFSRKYSNGTCQAYTGST